MADEGNVKLIDRHRKNLESSGGKQEKDGHL